MIVVADTSPINYLVLIGVIDVLGKLYTRVLIPSAVRDELNAEGAPQEVREWLSTPPEWLEICSVAQVADAELLMLGSGEREAILLAEQLSSELLIDEKQGRTVAAQRGLVVSGTLGVLREAARQQLLDLPGTLQQLRMTRFRVSDDLIDATFRDLR